MKKIVTVLGARPQFIKAAVLSRIIRENGEFQEVIVHTGQHFDENMSEIFFRELNIPAPTYNLKVNSKGHGAMTGQMMEKLEGVFEKEEPELVVVYGDTNSTLAGALVAKKMNIRLAHVEAGLRSFNMEMPEEINRILTDRISDILFCPTLSAVHNLEREGFDNFDSRVVLSGDIMKDSVSYYSAMAEEKSSILKDLGLNDKSFVLSTVHRQENTNNLNRLRSIIEGLNKINEKVEVLIPMHPRTRKIIQEQDIQFKGKWIDSVGYFDMLQLLKNCKLVMTDSGGLQKEAFFNKTPVIILREETEWKELCENGFAETVGTDPKKMVESFDYFSKHKPVFDKQLYGENPGEAIYREIRNVL